MSLSCDVDTVVRRQPPDPTRTSKYVSAAMSSSRPGPAGCQSSSSRVAWDVADMSMPKNRPMNPKCDSASAGSTEVTGRGRDRGPGDGAQARSGRWLLEAEADEPRCLGVVHGGPADSALPDVAGDALCSGCDSDVAAGAVRGGAEPGVHGAHAMRHEVEAAVLAAIPPAVRTEERDRVGLRPRASLCQSDDTRSEHK